MFDAQTEGRWDAHGRRSMTALSGAAAPGGSESPNMGVAPRSIDNLVGTCYEE